MEDKCFKLGIVSDFFEDGYPKIQFYGESSASEKRYKMLTCANPEQYDVVVMASMSDSYIILGSISGIKGDYLTETAANELYSKIDHTHDVYSLVNHNHNRLSSTISGINYVVQLDNVSIYTQSGHRLGNLTQPWNGIYTNSAPVVTSDANKKKDKKDIDKRYDEFFRLLNPVLFKYVDGESNRDHVGLYAQDVEMAMIESGITSQEFGGFIKSPRYKKNKNGSLKYKKGEPVIDEGNYDYGLRDGEFIGLIIRQLQKANKRLDELERREHNGEAV